MPTNKARLRLGIPVESFLQLNKNLPTVSIPMRKRQSKRSGVATVEFAICAPVLLIVGMGFINAGLLVQLKYNSKLIGHLAATEVFKAATKDGQTLNEIESEFEQLAIDLGIRSLDIDIKEASPNIVVVSTNVSVTQNSAVPMGFLTAHELSTETFVFARTE